MKKKIMKHWWVILLGLAIVCAPFALKLQNKTPSQKTGAVIPVLTLSASAGEEAETVRRMIADLPDDADAAAIAQVRAALDALPYSDRYAMAAEAARLDALESAWIPEEADTDPDSPPQDGEASEILWESEDTRLEILLRLLPSSLDSTMADLLRIAYDELDDNARTVLPPEILARYKASQPEVAVTTTVQGEEAEIVASPESVSVADNSEKEEKPVAAGSEVYMGSKNSDKYHDPQCSSAQRIKSENIIWFSSAAEAKSRGYSPCTVCKPAS